MHCLSPATGSGFLPPAVTTSEEVTSPHQAMQQASARKAGREHKAGRCGTEEEMKIPEWEQP